MPSCDALKSSATLSSTSTCSGASPVPRQQYQRITTSPGSAWEPVTGSGVMTGAADSDAPADSPGAVDADGAELVAGLVAAGPQAPTTRASTASRTAIRPIVRCICVLLL